MTDGEQSKVQFESSLRLLKLAVERGLLTDQQFQTLAESRQDDLCDAAVEQNLINSSDVDLLRPLAESETFLPGYEFLDVVGVGATGAVYKARDTKLGRMVALKLLKPSVLQSDSATARSRIEARIGASLQHPNVVVVHDYGVRRQRIYLAQEFIQGESVQDLIEREGRVAVDEALQIVRQVVSALNEAAASGIVHRDIKPANLLLTESQNKLVDHSGPMVKVTDFGLAFQKAGDDEATRLTVDGATLGTPSYAAPEQLVDSNVDMRADIYSLGATLFHMVTGKQPFQNANAFQAIADKMSGNEDWREADAELLPDSVRGLIRDMTHHAIEDRIPCYEELAERIQRVIDGADEPMSGVLPSHGSRTPGLRRRYQPVVVAGLTVCLVAAVLFVFGQRPMPEPVAVEADGPPVSLFDGEALPDRVHRQSGGGSFEIAKDSDRTTVLQGSNDALHFQIPPFGEEESPFFRFQVGVNVIDDLTSSDICFGIGGDGSGYHAVRLNKEVARFGKATRMGEDTDFEAFDDAPERRLKKSEDGPVYQVVRIEKQPSGWFVRVNEKLLGGCLSADDQLREVVIRSNGGRVHYADISTVAIAVTK